MRTEPEPEEEAEHPRRRTTARPVPPETRTLGKGGRQHKYLQGFIKRVAESQGYLVTIEKQVLGGQGSVDVALERDGKSIACEISVTTTVDQEIGNLEKCLAAGFGHVVLVASEKRALAKAREAAAAVMDEGNLERVQFLTPDELFAFLEGLEAETAGSEQVHPRPEGEDDPQSRGRGETEDPVEGHRGHDRAEREADEGEG